jgi:hypothetical protein
VSEFPIWLYWEGPRPAYIGLCLEIIRRFHPAAEILDRAGFDRLWIDDRDVDIDRFPLNYKSDFIRAYLAARHGGLYLDADTILFRRLDPVMAAAREHGFVVFGTIGEERELNCALIAAPAQSALAADYYARVLARARQGPPFAWLDLSALPLFDAMGTARKPAALLNLRDVTPVTWKETARLAERPDPAEVRRWVSDCWCFMLSNATMGQTEATRRFRTMTRAQLVADDSVLGAVFRAGLQVAPASPLVREVAGGWGLRP